MKMTSTGIDNLDLVLGGEGLERGSVVFVTGGSGSGKTVLAQQICFANGTVESPAIYYTMLAESHTKMIGHMEKFDFFDRSALGSRFQLLDLRGFLVGDEGSKVQLEGEATLSHMTDVIARSAIEERPSVVVVDAVKALRDVMTGEQFRRVIFDLATRVAHSGAILLLVGEYTEDEVRSLPEFAVGDGTIHLANDPVGRFQQRSLRVVKMRGADPLEGQHTFQITAAGIEVYPRFESTLSLVESTSDVDAEHRIATGIPELDEMTGGGLPKSSATLVVGPSGSGKTVIGLHFIAEGIARGERCMYLSFQQTEKRLIDRAKSFGWDFAPAVESGQLTLNHLNPVEVSLDKIGTELRETAIHDRIDRVVVDSLSEIAPAAHDTNRFPDYLSALTTLFRCIGANSLLTSETTEFFGPGFELPHGLAFVADNIIVLRYAELEGSVRRVLVVIKMRDGKHQRDLVEVEIKSHGLEVVGNLDGLTGVLGGTPTVTERHSTPGQTHQHGGAG